MMAAVKGSDTFPEVYVRKRLFAGGFRYRLQIAGTVRIWDAIVDGFRRRCGLTLHSGKGCRREDSGRAA